MKLSNLVLVGGVLLLAVVMIVGKYIYRVPVVEVSEVSIYVVSNDGLAELKIPNNPAVELKSISAWSVIKADALVSTFLQGYELSGPSEVLSVPALMTVTFAGSPQGVPNFFQEVGGLVFRVNEVEYKIIDNEVVSASFHIANSGKIYALEQHVFRRSLPAYNIELAGDSLSSSTKDISIKQNLDFVIYGQSENNVEQSLKIDTSETEVNVDLVLNDGESGVIIKNIVEQVLFTDETLIVLLAGSVDCSSVTSSSSSILVTISYQADRFERHLTSWVDRDVPSAKNNGWKSVSESSTSFIEKYNLPMPTVCN